MRVAFCSLARLGDIINCLPMCLDRHRRGDQVWFLHDARLSGVFQGVSYVTSVPKFLTHTKVRAVHQRAREEFDVAFDAQPFGPTYTGPCDHPHNVRAWLACGYTVEQFHDRVNYPLVFDRRDQEREDFVHQRVTHDRPLICLALSAKSNVFAHQARLADNIRLRWGNICDIVDLATVKAGRFYDLLGLFDRARVLVTVDTSAMHLAGASPVPVVCLMGDNDRTAAEPRCNSILRVRYAEWSKSLTEIHQAITQCVAH